MRYFGPGLAAAVLLVGCGGQAHRLAHPIVQEIHVPHAPTFLARPVPQPTIRGTFAQGGVVTVNNGSVPSEVSIVWRACKTPTTCLPVASLAAARSFKVSKSLVGRRLKVEIIYGSHNWAFSGLTPLISKPGKRR